MTTPVTMIRGIGINGMCYKYSAKVHAQSLVI